MEEKLTMAERIQQIIDEPKWSEKDKAVVIDRIKRRWGWIDLMINLDIQMSPEESKQWAEDMQAYASSSPSVFLQRMNTWETPDNRTMWYRWNNANIDRTPTGIIGDVDSATRYIESWGDRNFASEYVQYLRVIHNYLDQVEAPKQAFGHIPNHLFNTEGWYRKALMNGSLLYRKLLEKKAIEYGKKLNLWESFSRSELMGLVGLEADGKEMSGEQQAAFIQNMAKTYIENKGKKANQDEPLPEKEPEAPIEKPQPIYAIVDRTNSTDEVASEESTPKKNGWQAFKDYFSEDDDDIHPELAKIIEKKAAALTLREETFKKRWKAKVSKLPFFKRIGMACIRSFALQNTLKRVSDRYDVRYANKVDELYPSQKQKKADPKTIQNLVKPTGDQAQFGQQEPQTDKSTVVEKGSVEAIQSIEQEQVQAQPETPVTATSVKAKRVAVRKAKVKRKSVSTPRKKHKILKGRRILNEWRAARATQPKIGKSAEKPIIEQETLKNGDVVTVAFYPKSNKIVRTTEEFDSCMKKVDTIFIERKRDGIYGRVGTYYERVRLNAKGKPAVEHLASLTGQMTYGRAGIYVNSHDGIARKISYLSPNELDFWKNKMTEVKITERKRKILERQKMRSAAKAAAQAAMQQKSMGRAS